MDYDQDWQEKYSDMISTPAKALSHLRPGHRVFIGTGCGAPQELIAAMTKRAGQLDNVEIIQLITKGSAPYAQRKLSECFAINAFFISSNVREVIQQGFGDYTPILMSDIPDLLNTGIMPIDVALIQVTPPDKGGKVSLGISVDIVRSAADNASLVIAEVNPNMPWTHGDTLIDVYDLDILVPVDQPILEREIDPPNATSKKIAQEVAALIPNGATIELGLGRVPNYGRIPQVVMEYLHSRKDIGFHTEMISDTIIPLIESGAVTGARKTIDRGKITASFCMGTKKLYDFVDDNPLFSFRPTEYINDPGVIGKLKRMVSVNMALEVDLTGQVCSDSVEGKFYSGIGGQIDFTRGAAKSERGRAIICLPSLDREGGDKSRIVSTLRPGSGVVITRGTVHYVVTEYGVAYLHGKPIQERVMALISIAHPKFREQLFKEAVEAKYLRPDLARFGNRFIVPGEEAMRGTYLMPEGIDVTIRSIHPTDEPHMRDLVYNLSQETVYYRFMSHQRFTHRHIQDFVYIDHRRDVCIVGTVPEAHGEQIIAVGRYYLNEQTNMAEVAFIVRDQWQSKGLGSHFFQHLIKIAKRNGIAGFTAEVLRDNKRMQNVFNHSGLKVSSRMEEGVYSFEMEF